MWFSNLKPLFYTKILKDLKVKDPDCKPKSSAQKTQPTSGRWKKSWTKTTSRCLKMPPCQRRDRPTPPDYAWQKALQTDTPRLSKPTQDYPRLTVDHLVTRIPQICAFGRDMKKAQHRQSYSSERLYCWCLARNSAEELKSDDQWHFCHNLQGIRIRNDKGLSLFGPRIILLWHPMTSQRGTPLPIPGCRQRDLLEFQCSAVGWTNREPVSSVAGKPDEN